MLLSTGCWRKYIGVWEIKDDRLFLKALQGIYRLEGEEPLFADWFSGALIIPLRGMLKYFVLGYGSVQQGQMHIRVENGIVIRTLAARPSNRPNVEELGEKDPPDDEKRLEGDR